MCTGICWNLRCYQCEGVVMKDTRVSGHVCYEARQNGKRGCCRTGVEYTFYDRIARELCIACELRFPISKLNADTCDEAMSETRIGYHREDDDIDDNRGHDPKNKMLNTENKEHDYEDEKYGSKDEYEGLEDSDYCEDWTDTDDVQDSDDEEGGVLLMVEYEDGASQVSS
ncbi:hypothetical protein K449DRAFT_446662 [Hypoxylon sp. EC38]|nr:hypothetical protein K449DRAFT_446662 [Hypoxylon sp. EC38]